jgi:hypothetical protein
MELSNEFGAYPRLCVKSREFVKWCYDGIVGVVEVLINYLSDLRV